MKLRLIFTFFILGTLISPCAYYNTFYNTKKFYKEATKEREKRKGDKPSSAELNKYDQTIEKASKILEIYPKSKYVDDAVFILGECFYYKQDYVKAHRKFEELITYFPKSEYFYQAKLWLAKTNIKMAEYLSARFTLTEILETPKIKRDIWDESRYLLGEIQFEQAFYEEAAKEFEKVAETTKNKTIRAKAFYQLGLSQINTEDYFDAVQSFKMALKYSPDKQFAFDAELNLGKALKLSGDFKNASNVCLGLLEDESFKTKRGLVKLEIADCIYREGKALHDTLERANLPYLGKIEEALEEYKKITSEHRRTDVAAQAYYQMAKIYEEDFRDFASAKEYYDKVKLEYNRSEYVPESLEKAKNIGDLVRLKNLVKKSQGEQLGENNSHGHTMTELELLLLEHGVHPELRFMQKQRRLAQLTQAAQTDQQGNQTNDKIKKENKEVDLNALVTNKLQLAELYLFQFGQIDSALNEYREIINLFPGHPGAAKALFSYAFIYENQYQDKFKTDSLLYVLIERFPDSIQAKEARKILGLSPKINQTQIASELYKKAEQTLFTIKDTNQAIDEFRKIVEDYPNSIYAPKALYALGWIHEQLMFENDKAAESYKEILKNYPESEYSKSVKKKLQAVEKAAAKQEAATTQDTLQTSRNEEKEKIEPQLVQSNRENLDDTQSKQEPLKKNKMDAPPKVEVKTPKNKPKPKP